MRIRRNIKNFVNCIQEKEKKSSITRKDGDTPGSKKTKKYNLQETDEGESILASFLRVTRES